MSLKNRKQIVIDANVGHSASSDERFNPQVGRRSDHSRQCIQAVWEERHVAVFNRQLREEWERHASGYARSWLSRMTMKERLVDEEGEQFLHLLGPACSSHENAAHRAALAKDFHLIRSALASGQLIVSDETNFPTFVAASCSSVPELTALHYGNPGVEGEVCKLWIKSGAEKEPSRRIDAWALNYVL
jgi:hypothetical protein